MEPMGVAWRYHCLPERCNFVVRGPRIRIGANVDWRPITHPLERTCSPTANIGVMDPKAENVQKVVWFKKGVTGLFGLFGLGKTHIISTQEANIEFPCKYRHLEMLCLLPEVYMFAFARFLVLCLAYVMFGLMYG